MIVADASIVLAFIMDDESAPYAEAAVKLVAREGAVVPGSFQSEVTHALLQAERRGRIDASRSAQVLTDILDLTFTIEMPDPRRAMRIAREHRLTGYDAFYLALASQSGYPLATVNSVLRAAAQSMRCFWRPA